MWKKKKNETKRSKMITYLPFVLHPTGLGETPRKT